VREKAQQQEAPKGYLNPKSNKGMVPKRERERERRITTNGALMLNRRNSRVRKRKQRLEETKEENREPGEGAVSRSNSIRGGCCGSPPVAETRKNCKREG